MSSDSSEGTSDSSDGESSGNSREALSQSSLAAALSTHTFQPTTPHQAWNRENQYQSFAASGYKFSGQANYRVRRPESKTSSMAGSVATRYTSSTYTPSLAASVSTVASARSISTGGLGSSICRRNVLHENDDGVLERPALPGTLICEFHYLGCGKTFNSLYEWDIHSQTHFYGGTLPKNIECPFVCGWSISAKSGSEGWSERQAHIARTHSFGGQQIDTGRGASSSLIRHLWRERKIDQAQVQQLTRTGRLEENVIFVQSNGRTSDARRERRERR